MKKETAIVYKCEHCSRKMFGASAMSQHEKRCRNNPNNKHICLQECMFLKKYSEQGQFSSRKKTRFTCSNKLCDFYEADLYTYKLERKCYEKIIKDKARMPLQCNGYKYKWE